MNLASKNTAVLIFIRAQREEARLKQLAQTFSLRRNISIVKSLNKRIKKIGRRSNLPVYTISGERQLGANFGERLANSIQTVFQKGYKKGKSDDTSCL